MLLSYKVVRKESVCHFYQHTNWICSKLTHLTWDWRGGSKRSSIRWEDKETQNTQATIRAPQTVRFPQNQLSLSSCSHPNIALLSTLQRVKSGNARAYWSRTARSKFLFKIQQCRLNKHGRSQHTNSRIVITLHEGSGSTFLFYSSHPNGKISLVKRAVLTTYELWGDSTA